MPKLPKLGNLCELIDDGLRRIPQPDKCVFCINVKWGSILFVLMELVRISKHPVQGLGEPRIVQYGHTWFALRP